MIVNDEYAVQWLGGSIVSGFPTLEDAESYAQREISFLAKRFGTDIGYTILHRVVEANVVYSDWAEV